MNFPMFHMKTISYLVTLDSPLTLETGFVAYMPLIDSKVLQMTWQASHIHGFIHLQILLYSSVGLGLPGTPVNGHRYIAPVEDQLQLVELAVVQLLLVEHSGSREVAHVVADADTAAEQLCRDVVDVAKVKQDSVLNGGGKDEGKVNYLKIIRCRVLHVHLLP